MEEEERDSVFLLVAILILSVSSLAPLLLLLIVFASCEKARRSTKELKNARRESSWCKHAFQLMVLLGNIGAISCSFVCRSRLGARRRSCLKHTKQILLVAGSMSYVAAENILQITTK